MVLFIIMDPDQEAWHASHIKHFNHRYPITEINGKNSTTVDVVVQREGEV